MNSELTEIGLSLSLNKGITDYGWTEMIIDETVIPPAEDFWLAATVITD